MNGVSAALIETPSDFRETILGNSYQIHTLCKLPREIEPIIRRTLDAIFQDLQYIDRQDADILAAYLDGIEDPLGELVDMGFALYALTIPGEIEVNKQRLPWPNTHYFVIVAGSFFAIGCPASDGMT